MSVYGPYILSMYTVRVWTRFEPCVQFRFKKYSFLVYISREQLGFGALADSAASREHYLTRAGGGLMTLGAVGVEDMHVRANCGKHLADCDCLSYAIC